MYPHQNVSNKRKQDPVWIDMAIAGVASLAVVLVIYAGFVIYGMLYS